MASTAVLLFTRDLRVHDNPTLYAACRAADRVLPLFVLDEMILASPYNAPNRAHFLAGALRDLDAGLKRLGTNGLVVRRGDVIEETAAVATEVGADEVHLSADWSGYAQRRQLGLAARLNDDDRRLRVHEDTVVVQPPGSLTPKHKDHYAVFTPYFRAWSDVGLRTPVHKPSRVGAIRMRKGRLPSVADICPGAPAPELPEPGESAGRRRIAAWRRSAVRRYDERHDDLPGDATARISPYLHFGCLSPVEVVRGAGRSAGAAAFVRQLAWRDFHLQVLAARPETARRDYRHRGDRWRRSRSDLDAWRRGHTGIPIVDAAMRQLLREGWMHNRGRLLTASFLAKTLYLDWRLGARHFMDHLVDGDVANNQLNWQWVAGTGTDTRPNRVLNPLRQTARFDPDGDYVRRYVPELTGVDGPAVHQPWRLPVSVRAELGYPEPLVDPDEGRRRFLEARSR